MAIVIRSTGPFLSVLSFGAAQVEINDINEGKACTARGGAMPRPAPAAGSR